MIQKLRKAFLAWGTLVSELPATFITETIQSISTVDKQRTKEL